MTTTSCEQHLTRSAKATEALLSALLRDACLPGEIVRPAPLLAAMRYGALNGGKRLRPFLVQESAALLGGDPQAAARVGAAPERSEEHTSELQSLMRISYAVFCLNKKNRIK